MLPNPQFVLLDFLFYYPFLPIRYVLQSTNFLYLLLYPMVYSLMVFYILVYHCPNQAILLIHHYHQKMLQYDKKNDHNYQQYRYQSNLIVYIYLPNHFFFFSLHPFVHYLYCTDSLPHDYKCPKRHLFLKLH